MKHRLYSNLVRIMVERNRYYKFISLFKVYPIYKSNLKQIISCLKLYFNLSRKTLFGSLPYSKTVLVLIKKGGK